MPVLKTASICFALLVCLGEVHAQTGTTTAAGHYFRGGSPRTPQRQPRRPVPQPMDVSTAGKPFQNIHRDPTLSPYLSLDLVRDDGTALPGYYAFYQPQRQQQQANEAQEARLRRLQQQLRTATAKGSITRNVSGGMPTTGSSSQFMNLGGYYPNLVK